MFSIAVLITRGPTPSSPTPPPTSLGALATDLPKPSRRQTSGIACVRRVEAVNSMATLQESKVRSLFSLTFTTSVGANTKPAAPEHRTAEVVDAMAMSIEAFMMYWEAGKSAAQHSVPLNVRDYSWGESSPVDSILILSIQTLCLIYKAPTDATPIC